MKEKEEGRIFIEFGEEHYNPLGVIRSLGEMSIKPSNPMIAYNKRRISHTIVDCLKFVLNACQNSLPM